MSQSLSIALKSINNVGPKEIGVGASFFLAGALVALFGWGFEGRFGFALLFFGPLMILARFAPRVLAAAIGYYLALGWESVPALGTFFQYSVAHAFGLWLLHAAVNALPWVAPALLWGLLAARLRAPAWAFAPFLLLTGSVLSVTGPWASLSWGHPLMIAGQLYPGAHWLALIAVLLWWWALGAWLHAAIEVRTQSSVAMRLMPIVLPACILLSLWAYRLPATAEVLIHIGLRPAPAASAGAQAVTPWVWHAVDAEFIGPAEASADEMRRRTLWVREQVESAIEQAREVGAPGGVIVFPEAVAGMHRASIEAMFAHLQPGLQQQRLLVLLHANKIFPADDQTSETPDIMIATPVLAQSAVWRFGYSSTPRDFALAPVPVYVSRRPVPWGSDSFMVKGNQSGSALADLGVFGRAVMAVCFEGFLMEHWLKALREGAPWRAQVVVGSANQWFLTGPALRSSVAKQRLAMRRGAALLGLPMVFALQATPEARS